jgi:hypothetical protein
MDYKLSAMKKLRSFNDDSIPDGSTLASLKARRMAVAKEMIGQLGQGVAIEPPFFHTWGCNIFIGSRVYINRELVQTHPNKIVLTKQTGCPSTIMLS